MSAQRFAFDVTDLSVSIEEGFRFNWHGRDIDTGRLLITLDEPGSGGVIDYEAETVKVDFRVRIEFPELAEMLADMGADPALAQPVSGVIHSEGVVFPDHCFRLSGKADLAPHRYFTSDTQVEVRAPTRCKPDKVALSGEEIRKALREGQAVSWNFNPEEKRVAVTLPQALGGYSHLLCLAGSYTFAAADARRDTATASEPQQAVTT